MPRHIPIARRTFLRGAGVALTLPWLEAMAPVRAAESERPRRAVFCMWGLGVNGRDFTPKEEGPNFTATPILKPLDRLRSEFTLITGLRLTHSGGHGGDRTFLTGTNTHKPDCKLRVSVDQELAEAVGKSTRFPSLVLGIQRGTGFGNPQDHTLSWTRGGTPIPAENRPNVLFDNLFRTESKDDLARREQDFALQGSILDAVQADAKKLQTRLGKNDRAKLDEYFHSVRDIEKQIDTDRAWLMKPRPTVKAPEFGSAQAIDPNLARAEFDYRRYQRLMFDVIALALQTDSTRVISYMPRMDLRDGTGTFRFLGCPYGYHEMTHHGEEADKLKWLTQVDTWYMEEWAYFIERLKSIADGDGTLLDHTMLIWGSTGGTVNAHNNTMLPTIIAGGKKLGIRHRGHVVKKDVRLGNLWQTVVERMNVPVPRDFQGGEADGTIPEIV